VPRSAMIAGTETGRPLAAGGGTRIAAGKGADSETYSEVTSHDSEFRVRHGLDRDKDSDFNLTSESARLGMTRIRCRALMCRVPGTRIWKVGSCYVTFI
jgi:hypothetical protein